MKEKYMHWNRYEAYPTYQEPFTRAKPKELAVMLSKGTKLTPAEKMDNVKIKLINNLVILLFYFVSLP